MGPLALADLIGRMLLTMATSIDAMRMLLYTTAIAADFARHSTNTEQRETMRTRADLLTPLAKAWCTDEGVRLTSLAVQVHGSAGYIEETGIAQRFRDSRIVPIYEGTNGIQAIDLASRKIRRDGGAGMASLLNELSSSACSLRGMKGMGEPTHLLKEAMAALSKATRWMVDVERDEDWLSGATPYLELASLTVCGGLPADQLSWASSHLPSDDADRRLVDSDSSLSNGWPALPHNSPRSPAALTVSTTSFSPSQSVAPSGRKICDTWSASELDNREVSIYSHPPLTQRLRGSEWLRVRRSVASWLWSSWGADGFECLQGEGFAVCEQCFEFVGVQWGCEEVALREVAP